MIPTRVYRHSDIVEGSATGKRGMVLEHRDGRATIYSFSDHAIVAVDDWKIKLAKPAPQGQCPSCATAEYDVLHHLGWCLSCQEIANPLDGDY